MNSLRVRVKPRSRSESLTEQPDGSWLAQVSAMLIDGQANEAVIRPVAAHFGMQRAQVCIKRDTASRLKHIEIGG